MCSLQRPNLQHRDLSRIESEEKYTSAYFEDDKVKSVRASEALACVPGADQSAFEADDPPLPLPGDRSSLRRVAEELFAPSMSHSGNGAIAPRSGSCST